MTDLFEKLNFIVSKDFFFWFCAISGSGMLFIQLLLILFGIFDHDDFSDSGEIKWISKQTISGFLMMFGWSALACKREFFLSLVPTIAIALVIGLATVLVISLIFKMASKLSSPGTVFKIEDAIGKEAVVYQKISVGGVGKVMVCLNNFTHEIEAISDEDIPSFIKVKIVKKENDKTVVVVPIK